MTERSRILVTGAAGFIGSNFVRHLLRSSDSGVTILDALTYAGGLDTIDDVLRDDRVEFVHGDISDRRLVESTMDGHHAVVHFAAESHVDRSLVDPDAFMRTNCLGTNVLCDAARSVGVERFVHVSTDEVYGSRSHGSFTESDALEPSSPYSASKAGSDLVALSYHASFGLPVLVTRASNNYGPFQYPEKVIPLFVTNLLMSRRVPLYGNGANVRDWLHVDDHCSAIDHVLTKGLAGEIYNIGGTAELTNLELTERLVGLCDADDSMIEWVADRPGHDFRYSVDLERISELGWNPSVGIDHGLAETVRWYHDNRWWWESRRS